MINRNLRVNFEKIFMETIAIDTCLRNNQKNNPALNRIEELEAQGVLKIVVTQSFVDECHDSPNAEASAIQKKNIRQPFIIGFSKIGDAYIAAQKPVTFKDISSVMFPGIAIEKLSKNQANDVMHLMSCIHANVRFFVTNNKWDFIGTKRNNQNRCDDSRLNNKRLALEKYGIIILTPDELLHKFDPEINLI